MANARAIWEWIDVSGGFLRASNWYDDTVGIASLEAAIQVCSNANLQYVTGAVPEIGVVTPSGALYPLVQDCAQILLATVMGTTVRIIIPAPIASIFGPDGNTVDSTNLDVLDVITAATGHVTDTAGNHVTAYTSGVRVQRRRDQP
jgi:hypothetical protein